MRFAPLALRAMLDWYRAAEEQSATFALISELIDANALDYRAARHECVQVGTTTFCKKIRLSISKRFVICDGFKENYVV